MLVRAPYILPFVLATQDVFKEKKIDSWNNWINTAVHSRTRRQAELLNIALNNDSEEIKDLNVDHGSQEKRIVSYNQNTNVNILHRGKHHRGHHKLKTKPATQKVPTPLTEYKSIEEIKQEQSNCASNKKNQRYTSSFVEFTRSSGNLSVDKELDKVIGNNSKTKRTSSVHEGEDITLCWIETTTIKENKTARPPRRLVIREYTISFENSVTIPDRYLECKKLEGELTADDREIGKTALFDVMDEDTKVSKVVNFTSISHVGDIVVWQHKRVKCGVGPVVTKNIIEWTEEKENPKKRVEIKVSPKLHRLTATTSEKKCTQKEKEVEGCSTEGITEACESVDGSICGETTTTVDGITTKRHKVGPVEETTIKSTIAPDILTTEKKGCDDDSSDPACVESTAPSSVELSTELPTEAVMIGGTSSVSTEIPPETTTLITDKKITEKKVSSKEKPLVTTESSSESSEETSNLMTEETILSTTDISVESLKSSSRTRLSTEETPSTKEKEWRITKKVSVESSSVESTSKKKVRVTSSGRTTVSGEIDVGVTSTVPLVTEFPKESKKSSESQDRLTYPPTSIASTTASFETTSEESKESATSGETTIESGTTEEFIAISKVSTTSSLPEDKLTTLLPTSGGIESCENSEDCAHGSGGTESCDESTEDCGSTTSSSCESEICPGEKVTDQTTSDTSTASEIKPTGSPAKSTKAKIQHTTAESTVSSEETTEIGVVKTISPEVKSTISPPTTSGEIDLCENSESGSCTIKSCESEVCSEEKSTENQSISETSTLPSTMAKIKPTGSRLPSKSTKIKTQHTTAKSTAPITLASKSSEVGDTSTTKVGITSGIGEFASTTPLPTTSGGIDYSCENSEECGSCESGSCGSTTESCESEVCSSEEVTEEQSTPDTSILPPTRKIKPTHPVSPEETKIQQTIVTPGTSTSKPGESIPTTINNVPTTTESRRSTIGVSPHILILKIKISLEHMDENKEKHNLVEVEKQLSLDETVDPKHSDWIKQLKSWNDSVNAEAINALLNCTSLNNLTKSTNVISRQPNDSSDDNLNESESSNVDFENSISSKQTSSGQIHDRYEDSQYFGNDQEQEIVSRKRRSLQEIYNNLQAKGLSMLETLKRNLNDTDDSSSSQLKRQDANSIKENATNNYEEERNSTKELNGTIDESEMKKNISNEMKMEAVLRTLSGIQKDVSHGLQQVMSQLAKINFTSARDDIEKTRTDLLNVIADPKDKRIRSRRRRAAMEEVGHWSNERIKEEPMGGSFRSITEFILYKILS